MTLFRPLAIALTALALPASAMQLVFDDSWKFQKFPFQPDNDYALNGDTLGVTSDGTVSLVYLRTDDATDATGASWDWSVSQGVPPTDLTQKGGDDRNLSLYFVFADPEQAAALEGAELRGLMGADDVRILIYVWGGDAEPGSFLDSPYLGDKGKTIVLRGAGDGSYSETVDFAADLEKAFGARPSELLGIAVSADSDDTDTSIDAQISNLTLE
ncbi:DUF3047 domain-containing protein [Maribius pontilimi]|uniref:DUF3047 domain-containing protein n=1 Tax=Palleronia pontilimi TaxID=1964209 RepID=A0A934MFX8_9RHOB|nr:DUF3047 domain-containing protein [Palleronia pontilimi]MBJ3761869.1 DUF3047 domain-containing protein [Palleronia pontilimi]